MAQPEIHVEDIGTIIELTVKEGAAIVDTSTTTTKQIVLMKPDGSTLTKTAAFVTDGTDGKIKYTTIAGDLSVAGDWQVQGLLTYGTGTWHTSTESFQVHPNLT